MENTGSSRFWLIFGSSTTFSLSEFGDGFAGFSPVAPDSLASHRDNTSLRFPFACQTNKWRKLVLTDYAPNSALFRDQSQTEQEYTSAGFT